MQKLFTILLSIIFSFNICALGYIEEQTVFDRYNPGRSYFDYSVVLNEFPKDYYYTTVKINKSKERVLIITENVDFDNKARDGLFYYFSTNGFVYPLGYMKSIIPFAQSKNYLYMNDGRDNLKFYMSDNKLEIVKLKVTHKEKTTPVLFEEISSADKFAGDFGSPAGNDIEKLNIDGFYFEYHKPQYKKSYIKNLMNECISDGVKTQVQMYCCVVKKLHP